MPSSITKIYSTTSILKKKKKKQASEVKHTRGSYWCVPGRHTTTEKGHVGLRLAEPQESSHPTRNKELTWISHSLPGGVVFFFFFLICWETRVNPCYIWVLRCSRNIYCPLWVRLCAQEMERTLSPSPRSSKSSQGGGWVIKDIRLVWKEWRWGGVVQLTLENQGMLPGGSDV